MSNKGNIIDYNYKSRTIEMAKRNRDCVIGFISQEKICDEFLHFTPGVRMGVKGDGMDQQYVTPKEA